MISQGTSDPDKGRAYVEFDRIPIFLLWLTVYISTYNFYDIGRNKGRLEFELHLLWNNILFDRGHKLSPLDDLINFDYAWRWFAYAKQWNCLVYRSHLEINLVIMIYVTIFCVKRCLLTKLRNFLCDYLPIVLLCVDVYASFIVLLMLLNDVKVTKRKQFLVTWVLYITWLFSP